jgi:hypothetical protein
MSGYVLFDVPTNSGDYLLITNGAGTQVLTSELLT